MFSIIVENTNLKLNLYVKKKRKKSASNGKKKQIIIGHYLTYTFGGRYN